MHRTPAAFAAVVLVALLTAGCNPDGSCENALGPEKEMSCSSTTKHGCKATSGTFHAGKECKALGYKLCGGGWYKPGSVMCKRH